MMPQIKRIVNWAICKITAHKQSPAIEQRQWRDRKGRHVRFEYQCTCERCGVKSKWIRWKYYPDAPKGWRQMYR